MLASYSSKLYPTTVSIQSFNLMTMMNTYLQNTTSKQTFQGRHTALATLTCLGGEDPQRAYYIDGKDEAIMVIARAEARQVPRITKGCEALPHSAQLPLWFFLPNGCRHNVRKVHHILECVFCMAQQHLSKALVSTILIYCVSMNKSSSFTLPKRNSSQNLPRPYTMILMFWCALA